MSEFIPYAVVPNKGGLKATNYPSEYGSRAFKTSDDSYGGSMMPKTKGWQGLIPRLNGEGYITEYSLGGVEGEEFYPMVTQNMTPTQISNVQKLEAGLLSEDSPEVKDLLENAKNEYLRLKKLGKSAFMDYN